MITSMDCSQRDVQHRFRRFLLITGTVELVFEAVGIGFISLLGYHGFAAGEMGNMIGIFSVSVLLFLLPFSTARLAAVLGLRKTKTWAYCLTICLSALVLLSGLFIVTTAPLLFFLLVLYAAGTAWAAAVCLRTARRDKGQGVS